MLYKFKSKSRFIQ